MENKEMQKLFGSMLSGNKEEKSLFNFKPQEPTKPKSGGRKLTSALLNRIKRSATAAQVTTRETETFVEHYSGRDVEFTDVLYDEQNNRYIATTLNGVIATSQNGYDWEFTEINIPSIRSIKELEIPVWGVRFVACGTSVTGPWIGLSVDGLLWQQFPIQLTFTPYQVVTYTSNNVSQYVVVGEGGNAYFSENSTIVNIGSTVTLYDVIRCDGKVVAAGENGTVAISGDLGVTWDLGSSIATESMVNSIITTGNDTYPLLAAGMNGLLATFNKSLNNWSLLQTGTTENLNSLLSLGDGEECFVMGDNGTFLLTLDELVENIYNLIPSAVITTNFKTSFFNTDAPVPFLAMGGDGRYVTLEYALDDIFEEHYSGRDVEFTDVLYDKQNGRYLATTLDSIIATSTNGYDWEFVDIDIPIIYAVKELPTPILGLRFLACGVYNSHGWVGVSVDGLYWEQFPVQLNFIPYNLNAYSNYLGPQYVIVGENGYAYFSENNATTNIGSNANLYDITVLPYIALLICGEQGRIAATVDVGHTWEFVFSQDVDLDFKSLRWLDSNTPILVAGNNGFLSRYNGNDTEWISLDTNTHENLNKIIQTFNSEAIIVGDNGTLLFYDNGILINFKDIFPTLNIASNLKTGLIEVEAPLEFLALGDAGKFVTIKENAPFSKIHSLLGERKGKKVQ